MSDKRPKPSQGIPYVRSQIVEMMEALNGRTDRKEDSEDLCRNAKALCGLTEQYVQTVRVELEAARMVASGSIHKEDVPAPIEHRAIEQGQPRLTAV